MVSIFWAGLTVLQVGESLNIESLVKQKNPSAIAAVHVYY